MRYLLDTNVISELAKPQPNATLTQKFGEQRNEVAISSITLHEIRFGIERLSPSKRREFLESFFQNTVVLLPLLSYDYAAALWHAGERARLMAVGKPTAYADGQIAAIAHTNDLVIVTNNESDFALFNNVALENWTRA